MKVAKADRERVNSPGGREDRNGGQLKERGDGGRETEEKRRREGKKNEIIMAKGEEKSRAEITLDDCGIVNPRSREPSRFPLLPLRHFNLFLSL